MKRKSPNVFVTGLMATGVALSAIGCSEDTAATPQESSAAASPNSLQSEVQDAPSEGTSEVPLFAHPDAKPYNPARAKAEACLFMAVQKATGAISLSSAKHITETGLSYTGASESSTLTNRGVSTTYPVRMRVEFNLNVTDPSYELTGVVDVNATNPRSESPFMRPDNAVLHINPDDGKSYWIQDETRITSADNDSVRLGDVDTHEESIEVCNMVHGVQGTAGFMTGIKNTYE